MSRASSSRKSPDRGIRKAPTGIKGLDEITHGGLPQGRPTLVCGGAGCGKTLLAMEFLLNGINDYKEPGVFMAFEETADELAKNFRSLGFDIGELIQKKKLVVDFVRVERNEIEETGEYDLEGLFVRLGHAIDTIGAKRVVLDTIETLFSGLKNTAILRAELRRLFRWLKDRGLTAVITGERGEGTLTRQGLEEYVSDCVILLDHRVIDQISTRRLRVVKYRGSVHGTNEYPFLIDEHGIDILPITSMGLQHEVSSGRVPTGIPRLDAMLGGKGYYRGSTILISGTAGSGKSSLASTFVDAAAARGERCMYLAFEESEHQLIRNMRSIGLDLERWVKKDLLRFHATRSTVYGLERHLVTCHKLIEEFKPEIVVLDPIGTLTMGGTQLDTTLMLTRLMDFLKSQKITALWTNLIKENHTDQTGLFISSLVDTWLLLRDVELSGERNRAMYILKSRGMAHSNQIREFILTDKGIQLSDVYWGPEGALTGSARQSQEARERSEALARKLETEAKRRDIERKRQALEARINAMRMDFEAEEREASEERSQKDVIGENRQRMAASRQADNGKQAPRRVRKR
jgi:circadian clock protein KaiC